MRLHRPSSWQAQANPIVPPVTFSKLFVTLTIIFFALVLSQHQPGASRTNSTRCNVGFRSARPAVTAETNNVNKTD
ncbi:hypothetical protein P154DRAFT_526781 [Amniculicola lignicola CBS 123094]|uniref:Uncharacterized protein n=1 Tax=Amniculicola lignicola CBS 123094 TaxID=1392246 RepID=A0A6A5W444_9PLEO|nr:hypothetical protein P154DRAFT_526781 [Amniculicola lignicola CBS 123094]